ncbi:MAG TPA: quinohemoprotein amine dehydrogenase subunit alpha [Bryobacteraceae bacterium]|nr:quinohemoprotein amine dehydrogenase subunit alpha [Bryobacteraceae bacterium]
MTKKLLTLIVAAVSLLPAAFAQGRGRGGAAAADPPREEGIPVTDQLVISRCGTCHPRDAKGDMTRISWERTTPEGWEEAIKRMVRLNGLTITPEDARSIVKYLASSHGLAPEEAKPVMYIPEHRMIDETIIPNNTVHDACANCHAFGRPMSWRRSKEDWQYLANMHTFLYPQADNIFRRGSGAFGRRQTGADHGPEPVQVALDYLAKAAPLHTPEWAAWSARMRPAKLAGRWLVSAYLPGHGLYCGEMELKAGSGEDEFTTSIKLKSVKNGSLLSRTGSGVVYAGYSWRGRSDAATKPGNSPDDLSHEMREALWFDPNQNSAQGRWFWGEYQEFGFDVKLVRASADPTLLGTDVTLLKEGSSGSRVRLIGDNFPAHMAPADLDFGAGVTVTRVVPSSPTEIVAEVSVAPDAVTGKRDVSVKRSVLESGIAVYDHIDYIKVTPEAALAHLGSDVHPKGFQQFDAIAYNRGADGKSHTADDVELGPIDVTWSVEEFQSVFGDDDKGFVGHLSPSGLFTPASDGPNPERKFSRNNYGNVWVVATSKTEKEKDGRPMTGKAYLVVAVPTYIKWDQPEVEK